MIFESSGRTILLFTFEKSHTLNARGKLSCTRPDIVEFRLCSWLAAVVRFVVVSSWPLSVKIFVNRPPYLLLSLFIGFLTFSLSDFLPFAVPSFRTFQPSIDTFAILWRGQSVILLGFVQFVYFLGNGKKISDCDRESFRCENEERNTF